MHDKQTHVNPFKETLFIIIIYGFFGILWITLSDELLSQTFTDLDMYQMLQTYKGGLFVLLTMIIFFFLILNRLKLYHNSLEKYQLVISGVSDAIFEYDIVNQKYRISYQLVQKVGEIHSLLDYQSLIHEEDLENFRKLLETYLTSKQDSYQSIYRLKTLSNTYIWVYTRGKAIFDETGKPIRMAGSHSDITQQIEVREAIQKNEFVMDKMMNHSGNFMFILNEYGQIVKINNHVKEHYKKSDLIGENWFDHFAPHLHFNIRENLIHRMSESHEVETFQSSFIDENKHQVTILWTCTLLLKENENVFQLLVIGTDVTEFNRLKNDLHQLAYYDPLTKLPNRLYFEGFGNELIK